MKYVYSYLLIINVISFFMYYKDKRNSIKKKERIPEKVLLLVSIIGGSLGSLIGMFLFRHKTKHLKFLIINPICFIIQLYLLLTI